MRQTEVVARLRAAGCVFAEEEVALLVEAAADEAALGALVERRVAGEPLEPLLGWVAFGGLRVPVAPGVFVPRRRTELLAEQAAVLVRPGATVVELCCGAAAVSLVLLARAPGLELHAADVDAVAVGCASANLAGRAQVHAGDLYAALPDTLRGRVDLVVANAPYVPSGAIALMPVEAREHEPAVALDGGDDGLEVLRRVVRGASAWLGARGALAFECSRAQLPAASALLAAAGFDPRPVADDERAATVLVGTRRL